MKMHVARVEAAGLCTQCGTCAGVCPTAAVTMAWDRRGYRPCVDEAACTDCGACLAVCPGESFDFADSAPWRGRCAGAPSPDFLGPWRGLWFGWAADPATRYAGASGGVATAIVRAALEDGVPDGDGGRHAVDAVVCARVVPAAPLAAAPVLATDAEEVAACRGSIYNAVALNTALRHVRRTPGRYAYVGLPCHIEGLRLAQLRSRALRERVVFALGIFCGYTSEPRATELAARRAGLDPRELTAVSYRGPRWPGEMRLATKSAGGRRRAYPDYFDRLMAAHTPPRCRLCPDALAELADVSVGDAWLARFIEDPAVADGVSDVVARTPAGLAFIEELAAEHLTLKAATPAEVVASQAETYRKKRLVLQGRRRLRALAGRPVPEYPGLALEPHLRHIVAGLGDLAEERFFRTVAALRYP
ncbi:MAG: Coenzyme F420 hydrogenase/dehydrogenase, beta subunit C-terminal domain [Thermoleophilia bacterium]